MMCRRAKTGSPAEWVGNLTWEEVFFFKIYFSKFFFLSKVYFSKAYLSKVFVS